MKSLITRILIIEDNAEDEELLMRQLTKADLHTQVKVIPDGGMAFAYLADEEHQAENLIAVFLGLEIPTLSGVELLAAIRAVERLRHLPVILMATADGRDEIDRCHALGISALVSKPVTFSKFTNAVVNAFHPQNYPHKSRFITVGRPVKKS